MEPPARGELMKGWLRGMDLNHRPLGYEPNELPDCSTPQKNHNSAVKQGQTAWRLVSEQISVQLRMSRFALHPVTGVPWPVSLNSWTSHARLHSKRTRSGCFFALLARVIQRSLRHRQAIS